MAGRDELDEPQRLIESAIARPASAENHAIRSLPVNSGNATWLSACGTHCCFDPGFESA